MRVRQAANRVHWSSDDGDTGTATVVSRVASIRKEAFPTPSALGGPALKQQNETPHIAETRPSKKRPTPQTDVASDEQPKTPVQTEAAKPTSSKTYRVARVDPSDALNIRTGPRVSSVIAGTLPHDARGIVIVTDCSDAWCFISLGDKAGWVHSAFLEAEDQ
jgi:uncharacterized protein YgiM (DUF1202 family)